LTAWGFGLGVLAGLFMKGAAQRSRAMVLRKLAHRESERTMRFDENLPDPLERREPPPKPGQPRYGGTGAMGVSPAAAGRPAGER
jgi:hypothetical protein